jgi:hypothetical protein
MSKSHSALEPWVNELLLSGVNRLDCVITLFGSVMMELDDSPDNEDASEVQAIRWLYEALRSEAANIRDIVGMAQGQKSCVAKAPSVASESLGAKSPTPSAPSKTPRVLEDA